MIGTLQQSNQDQSTLHLPLSSIENIQILSNSDGIDSKVSVSSSALGAISSDELQSSTQNIKYTSVVSIQPESDIFADVTSKDENLSITHSTVLAFDDNLQISSTIGNKEESSDIDNLISTAGNYYNRSLNQFLSSLIKEKIVTVNYTIIFLLHLEMGIFTKHFAN